MKRVSSFGLVIIAVICFVNLLSGYRVMAEQDHLVSDSVVQEVYRQQNGLIAYEFPYDDSLNEKNYHGLQTFNKGEFSLFDIEEDQYWQIYHDIYNAITNLEDQADLSKYNETAETIYEILRTILNDYREIFYASGGMYWSNGILQLSYHGSIEEIILKKTALENKINEIINSVIIDGMTDYEKEKAIHDYIVLNTAYDYDNYLNGTIPEDSYHCYGVLIHGTGVCSGYAETLKVFMNRLGIECIMVVSSEMDHAWNMVNLDENWYHVDCTWDDTVPDQAGNVLYDYFNLDDVHMGQDHFWDQSYYPVCNDLKYTYKYYTYCMENNISLGSYVFLSGKITLPSGDSPCAEDIVLLMQAEAGDTIYYAKDYYKDTLEFRIPAGNMDANYSFQLPPSVNGYEISYTIAQPTDIKYFDEGYYSIDGTFAFVPMASLVEGNSGVKKDLDLELIKVRSISGTVRLPSGMKAPDGGMHLSVIANALVGDGQYISADSFSATISEGIDSTDYQIQVPINKSGAGYRVSYDIYPSENIPKSLVNNAYFNTEGATSSQEMATLVDVSESNAENIDINILRRRIIYGRISLPAGEVAPEGGVGLYIRARSSDYKRNYVDTVAIPVGSNFVDYSLVMSPDDESEFYIWYSINDGSYWTLGYEQSGYYGLNGMAVYQNKAALVGADLERDMSINLTVIKPTDTTLQTVQVNGTEVENFAPLGQVYEVVLPAFAALIPEITAVPTYVEANVSITLPESLPGSAMILVTSEDGSVSRTYTLNFVSALPSNEKQMLSFKIGGQEGEIENGNIIVKMPYGTELSSLIAVFESSALSVVRVGNVIQVSGETVNDFTNPVVYTVVAQDGSTQDYTVTAEVLKTYGDVSGDGRVTAGDATLVLRYIVGLPAFAEKQKIAADVSGDGRITAGDATLILRKVVGL